MELLFRTNLLKGALIMALFILTRTDKVCYDEYRSKVIRAKNVREAREVANLTPGDEGQIWDDLIKVKCARIPYSGIRKEILGSFNAG